MKRHAFYRWFRRVAMLSGIPALTMMFACAKMYGPPNKVNWEEVLDEETNSPIPEVVIQEEESNLMNDAPSFP